VYSIGGQGALVFTERAVEDVAGIGVTGALLVRPDGFVVWRCAAAPANAVQALQNAMRPFMQVQAYRQV
jgi:hypothetical protein